MQKSNCEGHISFKGFKIWYKYTGILQLGNKTPLVCLHGGPGATHDYLENLASLGADGRPVILYDQLGNGRSDHPSDLSLWKIDTFIDELDAIRKELGLQELHILGQSWGGMLAMEYALRKKDGIKSLILADSLSSTSQWKEEALRLRQELPPEITKLMVKHEKNGTTDSPEYAEASLVFCRQYLCRLDPWPDCLNRTFEYTAQNPVIYNTMWGPSEFFPTGNLKDWDIRSRLPEIEIPTLIISGRYDESTPLISGTLQQGIKNSQWVIFENSSHSPHLEEPEKFLETVNAFLDKIENSGS